MVITKNTLRKAIFPVHAIILRKNTSWMLHSVATVLHVSPIRGVITGRWVQLDYLSGEVHERPYMD